MNSASLASEFRNVLLRLRTVCEQFAKFARVANWLPTGCEIACFAVPPADFQYMLQNLHKTSKINARKIA